jgi:hypothetical protein
MKLTAGHGHRPGNMTGLNTTDIHPPGNGDPANMTAGNQTWHGHGDGNLTPHAQPPQQNGTSQGNNQMLQVNQDQKTANDDLITELIAWLKAHGIS